MDNVAFTTHPAQLVLMRVRSVAENPAQPWPPQPGFAGVVEAVGIRVMALRAGDAVYGVGDGVFAGYLCLPEGEIARMPVGLHFAAAAMAAIACLTALQALRDRGRLQRGERLLVADATGAGSRVAVQLGIHHGAHVTVACAPARVADFRGLGADVVHPETASGSTYDVVLHWGGSHGRDRYRRLLSPGGRLVGAGDCSILRSGADLAAVAALIDAGVLTLPPSAPPGCT